MDDLILYVVQYNDFYENFRHSLFKIKIQDEKQMKYLYSLAEVLDLDVWVLPFPGNDAAVLVSKESNEPFRSELSEYGFEFQIETDNIKR